jgi:tRNA modification GTPase
MTAEIPTETIFAEATAPGLAGVAMVRLSGPAAGAALERLSGALPPARLARRARLRDPATGEVLDEALVLWFPAPHSFTGENVAELQLHGGRAVVAGVLEALGGLDGLRPAEPGEFSRRAFVNGKMDLTAAEGLADLVAAETAAQRRQALRQLDGELGRLYDGWRKRLMGALAHAEAAFDFADEELPNDLFASIQDVTDHVAVEIAAHLDDERRGERLRAGVSVAIIGPPNAGKSSLLNRLAQRDVAIVTEIAGTTRDVIEVHLDLAGAPVIVADTAGLRETSGAIEAEGVRRARARAAEADVTLAVFDATTLPDLDPATLAVMDERALLVLNKSDLCAANFQSVPETIDGRPATAISCLTGAGISDLVARLGETIGERSREAAAPPLTRARHRAALADCAAALGRFADASAAELGAELAAQDLREAVRALGRITGRVDVDDILDLIFAEFCIGK